MRERGELSTRDLATGWERGLTRAYRGERGEAVSTSAAASGVGVVVAWSVDVAREEERPALQTDAHKIFSNV